MTTSLRVNNVTDSKVDVVVWDSHPLALGATPVEVWIDGIPQFKSGLVAQKPASSQIAPKTPNFDKEAADAIEVGGVPYNLSQISAHAWGISSVRGSSANCPTESQSGSRSVHQRRECMDAQPGTCHAHVYFE